MRPHYVATMRDGSDHQAPVFFDASGRRRRLVHASLTALLVAVLLLIGTFGLTLVTGGSPSTLLPADMQRSMRVYPARDGSGHFHLTRWLQRLAHGKQFDAPQVKAAFYVPWDPASRLSAEQHLPQIDWLMPATVTLTRDGRVTETHDERLDTMLATATKKPQVMPVIQNAFNDVWYGPEAAQQIANPAERARIVGSLLNVVAHDGDTGVVFDLENMPEWATPAYRALIAQTRAAFAPHHWVVSVSVTASSSPADLTGFARAADRVILMSYDQHSDAGDPGPIAANDWFMSVLRTALRSIPRDKLIMGIGSYAYDWHGNAVDGLTDEEAWLAARDSDARVQFDPASGNSDFTYADGGEVHHVWILDAASAWNQLVAIRAAGVGGTALWRLGSEDPGYWSALAGRRQPDPPVANMASVQPLTNVDVEGNGELLRIDATPDAGQRSFAVRDGIIQYERWAKLPTPYVVRRGGDRHGLVALTFDDGPDPKWTPQILDVLEREHVPGTFFVIGENAVEQKGLLQRIVADGSQIGNHSYTHPNMAQMGPSAIKVELTATQRLIEAYTGHSTRLFRAPYFGDAEPTTSDELGPALIAQQNGYLNVGLHVDPDDWMRPGADAIANRVIDEVSAVEPDRSHEVVLLHDGGGDRSGTVAALPRMIETLKARGYRFVTISELAGVRPAEAMPLVPPHELMLARADLAFYSSLSVVERALAAIFTIAITLGIARAVTLTGMAVVASRRRRKAPPIIPGRAVSVLIPCFNEARVIEDSVRRVLASSDVEVEVIVIDDGSTDGTSDVVRRHFANDPRVQLLTLPNGGKARALNRGLALARHEIVIALDADTVFEPLTIARLARWFDDPALGAVAGNAKVGNRVNAITRWQALEYVTAQNLERRALDLLGAVTVVPGAVGAWRRSAIMAVGGYPPETLAEDQDLTISIQRAGWRVAYDMEAVAWTEAPETVRGLARQRLRWAYGTLQCLWKHRGIFATGRPRGLALVALPQAWLFQIGFALISPVIDLALVVSMFTTAYAVWMHGWAQTQGDVGMMLVYWVAFMAIDALSGIIAYHLDHRERFCPVPRLLAQRFGYRQIMYWVVVRAVWNAAVGFVVGWSKLERTGRAAAAQQPS